MKKRGKLFKTKILKENPANLHYCTATEIGIVKSLCKESFSDFSREFWSEIVPEELHWNWHLDVLCNEIQTVCERVFRGIAKPYDLFINVPPGTSKSTFGSILSTPWIWTRMPTCRIIGGSFDKDLSLEFGNKCRRIVRSERYQELFPEIKLRKDQDTKSFFETVQGGVRRSTSTGASITGRHAHVIIIDDPLNPMGARSEAELLAAKQWMKETLPSRVIDAAITPLICIMQRLSLDDPTGDRLARSRIWEMNYKTAA